MLISNTSDISLPLAVWLLHDEYDYVDNPNYISVTGLMKPLRHIILPTRLAPSQQQSDVQDYISRALGHSIHDSIEKAWLKEPGTKLKKLGYSDQIISKVLINPSDEEIDAVEGAIPVYLEQRATRAIGDHLIGGKFDMVTGGIVNDTKSTTAYSWVYGNRDGDYQLQGSLYRWIDAGRVKEGFKPRITEDFIRINYIFTDWQKAQARSNPNYPQKRVETKDVPLLGLAETEAWIRHKLQLVEKYRHVPEHDIPECTDEELWRSDPKYKYFADPAKASDPNARSTKNFDNLADAQAFRSEKGKGVVVTVPGEVKRCEYCAAFDACTQKDRYFS